MPDTEAAMLFDTWYTVLSYPPQCKAFLEEASRADLDAILAVNDARIAQGDASTAQLTLGAITAQLIRVQLHLKVFGCMPRRPFPLATMRSLTFLRWLDAFHQDYTKKTQVWQLWQMCDIAVRLSNDASA